METYLLLVAAIFVWTGVCFYWKATKAVSDPTMWVLLIVGYLAGFYAVFGVLPQVEGDPIEMSLKFVISGFGLIGLFAAIGGAIVGDRAGSKA
jgi:hypothetical protein